MGLCEHVCPYSYNRQSSHFKLHAVEMIPHVRGDMHIESHKCSCQQLHTVALVTVENAIWYSAVIRMRRHLEH